MRIVIIFILTFMVFRDGHAQEDTTLVPTPTTPTTFTSTITFTPTSSTTLTSTITPVSEICTPEPDVCSCPPNEVYSPCLSDCGDFCDYAEPQVCIPQCFQGCTCKKGYCRDPWSKLCNSIEVKMCQGNNEHYEDGVVNDCCTNECNEVCPGTGPKVCEEPCGQGCFCDPGYYRHPVTKSCVESDCCPDVSIIECGESEIYSCSNDCQEGCGNELELCTTECYDGCWCDVDHKRDPETGLCVFPEDCPSFGTSTVANTVVCGENEVFLDCGPCGGDYYCDRDVQCDACEPPGCYCDPAYAYCRDTEGNCVPRPVGEFPSG